MVGEGFPFAMDREARAGNDDQEGIVWKGRFE
jgi:hypothetical protein